MKSKNHFDPFGIKLPPINSTDNRIKYTGQERDTFTNYDYMHFRFYASSMGRFLKPDNIIPDITNPQNWNAYTYVKGNPVNFNDPSGHFLSFLSSTFFSYVASVFGVNFGGSLSSSSDSGLQSTLGGSGGNTQGSTDSISQSDSNFISPIMPSQQIPSDPNTISYLYTPDTTGNETVLTLGNCGNELDINQNGIIENPEITNVIGYEGEWTELPKEQQATVVIADSKGQSAVNQIGIVYRLEFIYTVFVTKREGCENFCYKAVEPQMLSKPIVWMPNIINPSKKNPYEVFPYLGGETYNRPLLYGSYFVGPCQCP